MPPKMHSKTLKRENAVTVTEGGYSGLVQNLFRVLLFLYLYFPYLLSMVFCFLKTATDQVLSAFFLILEVNKKLILLKTKVIKQIIIFSIIILSFLDVIFYFVILIIFLPNFQPLKGIGKVHDTPLHTLVLFFTLAQFFQ